MSRNQASNTSYTSSAAMISLFDLCDNVVYSDDNGALLGQLSMLRAGIFVEAQHDREWHEAVSCDVSAH